MPRWWHFGGLCSQREPGAASGAARGCPRVKASGGAKSSFAIRRAFTDISLKAHPNLPRFGWLGTMDGGWDGRQQTIDAAVFFRPDLVYFEPGPSSVVDGYHDVYHSLGHGTWIEDFVSGDQGDITD